MSQFEHDLDTKGFASINDVRLAIDNAVSKTDFTRRNRSGRMPTTDWICLANETMGEIRIDAKLRNSDDSWGDGYERLYLEVSDDCSREILIQSELTTLETLNSELDGIMVRFQLGNWE